MRGFMHRFRHGFRHRFIPGEKSVTLARLQPGQSGTVVEILGGYRATDRLNALGIRPGKRITKVSSMLMRGPVTVQLGSAQVAIGFGMANKVIIKLD